MLVLSRKLATLALALACALRPTPAAACGGFFCSRPPPPTPAAPMVTPQPIFQTGEKIVFSVDPDGTVTAVVQVAYTGPSQSFAWIVPVSSMPEVSLGTRELIDIVDSASNPSYQVAPVTGEGTCAPTPACTSSPYPVSSSGGGCGGGGGSPSWHPPDASFTLSRDGGVPIRDGGARDSGVTVLAHDELGPYDIVVLSGVDALAVARWLDANGYLFPEEARALLEPYGDAGDVFVAVRLRKDVESGELVPIVLRYVGEPCIPIRLTAVATVPDMPITAYFLSDVDMRSDNYAETELPDDPLLWTAGGVATYDDILSNAVDDAGGHAFVREFAGPTPGTRLGVPDFSVLEADRDPKYFVSQLSSLAGLHAPELLGSLARSLPPPDGVAAGEFFSCLARASCTDYDTYLRTVHFDPVATAAALERDYAAPRRDTNAMLADHPRLTRLATTLSAEEMTIDPTFVRTPPRDVARLHTARLVSECSSGYVAGFEPIALRTPDGTEAIVRAGVPYLSPESFCAPYGGVYHPPPPDSSSSSGCLFFRCETASGTPTTAWLIGTAAIVCALVVRRRRRR